MKSLVRVLFLLPVLFLTYCGEHRARSYIAALSDPRADVRRQASYELVMIGDSAVEPLIAATARGSDSLQYIGAQILGRIGDRRAIPFLRELAGHSNPFVRQEAVLALGKMGDPSLISPLVDLLADDAADSVRAAAAQSLANLRDTAAVAPLLAALDDPAPVVRQQSLAALYRLWTPAATGSIIQALQDPDETVRFVAAQILGQRRVRQGRDPLCIALSDTSVWVRAEAARALGELGDPDVAENLVHLMKTHDGPDHAAARKALRHLTGADYVLLP